MLLESEKDIQEWLQTTNHKPPFVYEYMFTIGKTKYVVTAQILKDNRRIAYVTFGRVTGKRMLPLKVKAQDYKRVLETIYAILGHIRETNIRIRGFVFSFPASHSRVVKPFAMAIKRLKRKYPKLKFKLYKRETEDRIDFLLARQPFTDMNLFGDSFSEVELSLEPVKRVRKVKQVKVIDRVFDEVEYDFISDIEKIEERISADPGEFEKLGELHSIDNDTLESLIKNKKHVSNSEYRKIYESDPKYLEYTNKIKNMIGHYTGSGYTGMSGFFRGNLATTLISAENALKFLDMFDDAPPLKESMVVLRNINKPSPLEKVGIGELYIDPGFLSTSIRIFGDWDSGSIIMRIFLPKGTKVVIPDGLSEYPEEFEITLGPGSVLKLVDKKTFETRYNSRVDVYDMIYMGNIRDTLRKEGQRKIEEVETKIENFKRGTVFNSIGSDYVFLERHGEKVYAMDMKYFKIEILENIKKSIFFKSSKDFGKYDIDYDIVKMDRDNAEIGGIYAPYGNFSSVVFKVESKTETGSFLIRYPKSNQKKFVDFANKLTFYKFTKFPEVFVHSVNKEYVKEVLEDESIALVTTMDYPHNFFVKLGGKYYNVMNEATKPLPFDKFYDHLWYLGQDGVFKYRVTMFPKSMWNMIRNIDDSYFIIYYNDTEEAKWSSLGNIDFMLENPKSDLNTKNVSLFRLAPDF